MVDTLVLAKARFPGCRTASTRSAAATRSTYRQRTSHNALLDCRLLSDVYVELTGGRQPMLLPEGEGIVLPTISYQAVGRRTPVLVEVSADALARHAAFVARLPDPVWLSA